MKWIGGLILILGLANTMAAMASAPEDLSITNGITNLVWSDEFNGTEINLDNWSYETEANGWSPSWNNEWQTYTDNGKNGLNAFVANGVLTIRAIRVKDSNALGSYTSARMVTKGKHDWTYGRIGARIKMPYGNGIWPAFWLLGTSKDAWPACGEIDVVELIGGNLGSSRNGGDSVAFGTLHGPGYSGADGIQKKYRLSKGLFKDDFHDFEVVWNKSGIYWMIDGNLYHKVARKSSKWVFDAPFYILLNLAVGGNWGGYPDGSTVFPQDMVIDWVRVYQ